MLVRSQPIDPKYYESPDPDYSLESKSISERKITRQRVGKMFDDILDGKPRAIPISGLQILDYGV